MNIEEYDHDHCIFLMNKYRAYQAQADVWKAWADALNYAEEHGAHKARALADKNILGCEAWMRETAKAIVVEQRKFRPDLEGDK